MKRSGIPGTSRAAAMLCLTATMALLLGCTPEPGTVPQASSRDPGAVERGRYLFDAANCAGCHTDSAHGGARLAGGRGIESPFGTYYSRNITPDPRTGIGAWSDADFLRALRRGISPSGAHYFPVFPFPAFTGMTDRDILDIRAYLATQPPVVQADRAHDVSFPFDMRLIMVPWRALYFAPGPLTPLPQRDATWNRGRYLARAVVHCPECHTPRNGLGALETDRWLGGGIVGKDDKAPNITSDPTDGIGKWSEDDIVEVLTSGVLPDGDMVGGPMREVAEGTAKLSDADRRAIAAYIKTIPAKPSAVDR